jgi:hypothetical protein
MMATSQSIGYRVVVAASLCRGDVAAFFSPISPTRPPYDIPVESPRDSQLV